MNSTIALTSGVKTKKTGITQNGQKILIFIVVPNKTSHLESPLHCLVNYLRARNISKNEKSLILDYHARIHLVDKNKMN